MQRALLIAAIALAAFTQSVDAQQAPSPPPAPTGAAARDQADMNKTISTMDGFGAYGDGLSYYLVSCFTNNAAFCGGQPFNVVSFPATQNFSLSTTISGTAGGGTVTTGSGTPCRSEMAGSPVYIPGAGQNGAGLRTRLIECIGTQPSNKFQVDPPLAQVPSGTLTIGFGAMALNGGLGWQASDAGKGIHVGYAAGTVGTGFTIAAVNSPTNITLSANSTGIAPNVAVSFVWGHDDSVAVGNACNAVLQSGLRDLQVPVNHYAPTLSDTCYGAKMHGNGAIMSADFTDAPITGSANGANVTELVVSDNAPAPAPPSRAVIAARDLPQTRACGPAPTIINSGDSLEALLPNQLSGAGTYPATFQTAFRDQNRGITANFRNAAAGGAQVSNFDGNPNQTNTDVLTSTSTAWLSQMAAATPCGVTIGFGNNDGVGLSLPALVDSYLKLTGVFPSGGSAMFSPVPDIVYFTHHPYSRINNQVGGGSLTSEGDDYSAGYICSFAKVMGRPCIDGSAEGEKHLFGYDPTKMRMVRRYDLPYNTSSVGFPLQPGVFIPGFAIQFNKSGQNGAAFWANFTGNGGATDPRGAFVAFQVGYNNDNICWIFYNGTNPGYECDPSAGLPGLGALGANGAPPVTPTLLSNITVTTAGGNTTVTSSANVFGPCVVGNTVAVPGAGPTITPPGYFSYTAPFIATINACSSASQMTLTGTAANTYAAQPGFVMFGNPVVYSGVTDASNCANEPFGFEVAPPDQLRIWFCSQFQVVYAGPVMRSRNRFQPRMFSGGNKPSLTVAADSNGGTTFMVAQPIKNQVTFTDDQVNGPATNAPLSNQAYGGPEGGDGNNHNTAGFGERVIQALMDAQDLSLGLSQGFYSNTPATGFSLTIPNGYGTVLLTPAGTLLTGTITLPASYPQNQDLVITSTQTITALTLNANSGQTVNGAPTTLAGNTSAKFRLEGTSWYRLQ